MKKIDKYIENNPGESDRSISLRAGLSDSALKNLRHKKAASPKLVTAEKIAKSIGCTLSAMLDPVLTPEQESLKFLVQNLDKAEVDRLIGYAQALKDCRPKNYV